MKSLNEILEEYDPNERHVVKDKLALKKESDEVDTDGELDDLYQLVCDLYHNLQRLGGVGLSAPQVGVFKRVCVVDVGSQAFYLVNPEIVDKDQITGYVEGCLSFPGDEVKTRRYVDVTVEADNFDGRLAFGPGDAEFELNDKDLLESVATQHEIDHLNGVLMYDRRIKADVPFEKEEKEDIGRNDKVKLHKRDGDEMKEMKYKHANKHLDMDEWKVVKVVD